MGTPLRPHWERRQSIFFKKKKGEKIKPDVSKPWIDPQPLLTRALSSLVNTERSHSWRCEVDTEPPHDTVISNQWTTFWHLSSTSECLCRLKCPHFCSVGVWLGQKITHTHTHRGLNNEQGGALFPVRSGDKRSNYSVRLDVALGSGPLWDRWDTLEGHVFPSPHRLVKSSPFLTLHRLRPSLREREKKGERERG